MHDLREVLVRLEGAEYLRLGLLAEVLQMELRHLAQVIFQLIRLDLDNVVAAQDHVLDQLGDLLVELDHIWLLVDKFLDLTPFRELGVGHLPLGAASECADEAAEQLSGQESLALRLLDLEDVRVHVEAHLLEGSDHLLSHLLFADLG